MNISLIALISIGILGVIALIIAIIAVFFPKRLSAWDGKRTQKKETESFEKFIDTEKDPIQLSGVKGSYSLIQTNGRREELLSDIMLRFGSNEDRKVPTNWKKGIEASYRSPFTFVSAEINGYVIIPQSFMMGDLSNRKSIDTKTRKVVNMPFVGHLSEKYERILFFGGHRVSSWGYFMEIEKGLVKRAYEFGEEELFSFGLFQEYERSMKERQYADFVKDQVGENEGIEDFKKADDYVSFEDFDLALSDAFDLAEICKAMTGIDQLDRETIHELGTLLETNRAIG